jgi:hypothetical protein
LLETLARWRPLGEAAIATGAGLLGSSNAASDARTDWATLLNDAGLAADG